MAFVLYGTATGAILRVAWICFGGCVPLLGHDAPCPAPVDMTLSAFLVAELTLGFVFFTSARKPESNMPVVWAALASLAGRTVADFHGALTLPPPAAMAHLVDLVLVLALISGWLRAIPETLQASRRNSGL